MPGIDDRDRPGRAVVGVAAEEARDRLERALRRRQPDALRRLVGQGLEPLERERQVRPALGARERVDLVDDHGADGAQRLARRRGEHQVEGFRRRDEDVGRVGEQLASLARGRVSGSHPHDHLVREAGAGALGRVAHAGERRPQVLLHVDRERAQRRDVDDAGAGLRVGGGGSVASRSIAHRKAASVLPEPVGASTQGVLAPSDGLPALRLSERGRVERRLEPVTHRWREGGQAHDPTLARNTDNAGAARIGRQRRMRAMSGRSSRRLLVAAGALVLAIGGVAHGQTSSPAPSPGAEVGSAEDQVVLSGTVSVPRGRSVGEVVVFHGRAVVAGVVVGDVVVLDGPVVISGQVSGTVVAMNGPIRLAAHRLGRG